MIGTISSFNVYKLGRSIDGLMIDNYRSINTANKMNNCIEAQDKAILQYILLQKKEAVDSFYNSNDEFYKWFNIENNNITIVGEKELVSKINQEYIDFSKSFSKLQDYESNHSINETVEYYNTTILVFKDTRLRDDFNHCFAKLQQAGRIDAILKAAVLPHRKTVGTQYLGY